MNELAGNEPRPTRCVGVLSVSPSGEESAVLDRIVNGSGWTEYSDCKWLS